MKKRLSENDLLQTSRLNECRYSEFGPHEVLPYRDLYPNRADLS